MMGEAVIVALITGGVALAGNLIAMLSNGKLLSYKIDELKNDFADLRTRVNKHNNLVERMTAAEQSVKSAHHRIDEIKGAH